ncbi:MAG: hypothetical protein JEZ07_14710 [Phycisphaerae bacterium]|nr:hypothetical protein [Phycisphaerae bacterium]
MKINTTNRLSLTLVFISTGLIMLVYGTFFAEKKILKPEFDLENYQKSQLIDQQNWLALNEFRVNRELSRDGIHRIYVEAEKQYIYQLDGNPAEFCPT